MSLSLHVPGSLSSELQTRYLSPFDRGIKDHLRPVKKPAPPFPLNPEFLILVMEELGHDWINPKYLRIGASSLLIDIERQLYHFALGRYANKEKLAIG